MTVLRLLIPAGAITALVLTWRWWRGSSTDWADLTLPPPLKVELPPWVTEPSLSTFLRADDSAR